MAEAQSDGNFVRSALGVSSTSSTITLPFIIDSVTGRLLTDAASGAGTVTSVSVTTANGVSGSVATATTTPAITLTLGAITPSSVQVSGLTASQILSTDASKNLTSLAVATYPSLTELAYVKGVTSDIQTQFTAKLTNPMTTGGDVIYGGASGAPTRLANGSAGQVLQSNGTTLAPTWVAAGAGDMVLASVQTVTGAKTFGTIGGAVGKLIIAGATSGSTILDATAAAGSTTLTLPAATDTLVGKATTDTLTNKTIDADGTGNSITNIENADIKAAAAIAVNKLAALTASEIVISNVSGFIASAAVATYPSLAELIYVKGVTSAIQTQLTARLPLAGGTMTGDILGAVNLGATGTRILKLWATDITVTNAITGAVTGNAGTVTNATLTTALTVNTGTLTLTAAAANTSVLTIGAGAVSVSGSNTGDNTVATSIASRTLWGQTYDGTANVIGSLTAVTDITGGASNMVITSGTGASRTLALRTTTSGSTTTTALTLNATQDATFAGNITLGASTSQILGAAGNMTIISGTGASRTMILQTTTSGSTATTALTLNADQSATFAGVANMTSPAITTSITTPSTSFTALAGATTLLTIGGTGASAVFAIPGTLEQSTTTGALTVAGGVYIAKVLQAASTIELGHATDTTLSRVSAGVAAIEGVNILTTATGLPLAGGTMTGVITLGENTSIALDPAGSADGKYTGITVTGTAGAALAFGDLIYLAVADSRWELTDADATATAGTPMIGMCVLAAAADGDPTTILLMGIIRADAKFPALTVGAPAYVGETAGLIQVAIPTGADNVIRVVGRAMTADELYFNPSMDHQITVA